MSLLVQQSAGRGSHGQHRGGTGGTGGTVAMQCRACLGRNGQGDDPWPGHPLAQAGVPEAGGIGWESWSRAGLEDGTSFQSGEADSGETHPSAQWEGAGVPARAVPLAQVPWHLDGTGGWRAALSIGWGPCLLLGPSQRNDSTVAPVLGATFTPPAPAPDI